MSLHSALEVSISFYIKHIKPAVGVWVVGSLLLIRLKQVFVRKTFTYLYTISIIGAGGAALLYIYTPSKFRATLGALTLHQDIPTGYGVLIELTLTFVLIWTVISSTDPVRNFTGFQAPLAIGLSVAIGLMMGVCVYILYLFCTYCTYREEHFCLLQDYGPR